MTSCTSSEKIMDALSLLDEDMAEEVGRLRGRRPKKPSFMRYGMIAAGFCVTLLCVLQLVPLMGRVPEDGVTGGGGQEDVSLENAGTNNSLTDTGLGSIFPTVSESEDVTAGNESKKPEADEEDESQSGETGSVSDDEENLGGGTEGMPGDEPLPALNLRVEGYDGDTVVCTVVGNEGCTFYPVGNVVVLRFDFWEGEPVTETSFTRGGVYSVLFTVGYDSSDENTLYAVIAYQLEE